VHRPKLVRQSQVDVVEEPGAARSVVLVRIESLHDVLLASLPVLGGCGLVSQVDQKVLRPVFDILFKKSKRNGKNVKNTRPSPRCSSARNGAAPEILKRITLRAASLIDSAQIFVQPREDILNKFGAALGDIVRSVKFHVAFVGWWSAEHFE
jgi:hypothetical protein